VAGDPVEIGLADADGLAAFVLGSLTGAAAA
jgi:hypothetical protein